MCWISLDSFCFLVKAIEARIGVIIPMGGDDDRLISCSAQSFKLKESNSHIVPIVSKCALNSCQCRYHHPENPVYCQCN